MPETIPRAAGGREQRGPVVPIGIPLVPLLWTGLIVVEIGWATLLVMREAGTTGPAIAIASLFDLDGEAVVPAWFSSSVLMLGALASAAMAAASLACRARGWKGWVGLAFGFGWMSMDESVSLHERLGEQTAEHIDAFVFPAFAWVIPFSLVLVVLAAAYLPFLRALPRADARSFLIAGAVFVGGAFGVELVGGLWINEHGADQLRSLPYLAIVTVEETLEFAGAILFVRAVLRHAERRFGRLALSAVQVPVAVASLEPRAAGRAVRVGSVRSASARLR